MLPSNTISVLLITVRSLSRKGLFGKSNVVVPLMKSFINVGLSSWCFCFFLVCSSGFNFFKFYNYPTKFWPTQIPSNQFLSINEGGCTSKTFYVFVVLFMELTQCHARELLIGLQKREVSCLKFFILVRTRVLHQFHIKPINSCTSCINESKAKNQGNMWCQHARYSSKLPSWIDCMKISSNT